VFSANTCRIRQDSLTSVTDIGLSDEDIVIVDIVKPVKAKYAHQNEGIKAKDAQRKSRSNYASCT